jgi:hypothetical protein
MLTAEEFKKLTKEHKRLMKLADEQIAIMHKINSNMFTFLLGAILTRKFKNARKLAEQYLDEGNQLLHTL